ncbi:MAG: histone deacetylase family protein [Gammaproteobacteria bacterium]
MSIHYITNDACRLHDMGGYHPEAPERIDAINDRLIASGLGMVLHHHDAPQATVEQLARAHDAAYIKGIFDAAPAEGIVWLDGDTAMNPHTLNAARCAAGAAIMGVDLVMNGQPRQAFCNVRPPGHHAERRRAMGFCLFNNVAVAALHALEVHGIERVAILDFDVHHGNGTEDIVAGDERILFCSTFQHPFYPHSGADCKADNVVNVPLPAGTIGVDFREAVHAHWWPRLRAFEPQLLLFSAGFDAHSADDMGQINLIDDDYAWVTRQAFKIVEGTGEGRVVSLLEGGYELKSLARSVEAHLKAFLGAHELDVGGGFI